MKKKLQVAVIGLGRLGSACANALLDESELALAGVVRRPESLGALHGRLQDIPVTAHVRDLPAVDLALVCVPAHAVFGVAWELLQARIPIVECAILEDNALLTHRGELDGAARKHRVSAIVGAGWNPGVLQLFTKAFEMLIPRGQEAVHRHPGVRLYHSAAVLHLGGVKDALAGECRADGELQRYVYVVLQPGADFAQVSAAIAADPLFAGETTEVFQLDSLAGLAAEEGQGIVLERYGSAVSGMHASLLLESRFELADFAARVMLDAARRIPELGHGAHPYRLDL